MDVIYITGKAGSGKTEFGNACKDVLTKQGVKARVVNYGDLIKFIGTFWCDWNGKKDEKGRTCLQEVGDRVREYDHRFFITFIENMMEIFDDDIDVLIVADCRYGDETALSPDVQNCIVCSELSVRIIRKEEATEDDHVLNEQQKNHSSETAMDEIEVDMVISNDGTLKDLQKKAVNLCASYKELGRFCPMI